MIVNKIPPNLLFFKENSNIYYKRTEVDAEQWSIPIVCSEPAFLKSVISNPSQYLETVLSMFNSNIREIQNIYL